MLGNTHPNIVISEELNLKFTDVYEEQPNTVFVFVLQASGLGYLLT